MDTTSARIANAVQRAVKTVRWGDTFRDRLLIASYYGLLLASRPLRPGEKLTVGVHPQFWLGRVSVTTPLGRFACRAGTSDFDIINPNYEVALTEALFRHFSS